MIQSAEISWLGNNNNAFGNFDCILAHLFIVRFSFCIFKQWNYKAIFELQQYWLGGVNWVSYLPGKTKNISYKIDLNNLTHTHSFAMTTPNGKKRNAAWIYTYSPPLFSDFSFTSTSQFNFGLCVLYEMECIAKWMCFWEYVGEWKRTHSLKWDKDRASENDRDRSTPESLCARTHAHT